MPARPRIIWLILSRFWMPVGVGSALEEDAEVALDDVVVLFDIMWEVAEVEVDVEEGVGVGVGVGIGIECVE
jgi:hypothetical protein